MLWHFQAEAWAQPVCTRRLVPVVVLVSVLVRKQKRNGDIISCMAGNSSSSIRGIKIRMRIGTSAGMSISTITSTNSPKYS